MRPRTAALSIGAALTVITALASPASAHGGDRDHDGLPDRWETRHGLDARHADARRDPDHDGLTNRQEFRLHGDPRDADTDDDGLNDGLERRLHLRVDNADSDHDGIGDFDEDRDHDGICNGYERSAVGTVQAVTDTVLTIRRNRSDATLAVRIDQDTEVEVARRGHHRGRGGHVGNASARSEDSGDSEDGDSADDDSENDDSENGDSEDGDSADDGDGAAETGPLVVGAVVLRIKYEPGSDGTRVAEKILLAPAAG